MGVENTRWTFAAANGLDLVVADADISCVQEVCGGASHGRLGLHDLVCGGEDCRGGDVCGVTPVSAQGVNEVGCILLLDDCGWAGERWETGTQGVGKDGTVEIGGVGY